jgi:hypothetical protein
MPDFVADLPAAQVHTRLQAALDNLQEAEQNAVLWFADVVRRKLYGELGYSSIQQYAQEALGFSVSRTWQFLRLSDKLETLSELRQAVEDGSIPWTKAREVAGVATPDTETAWVNEAKTASRRDLRKKIEAARAKRKAEKKRKPVPESQVSMDGLSEEASTGESPAGVDSPGVDTTVEVTLRFTPEEFARLESLMEQARKRGETGKREDLLLAGMASLTENFAMSQSVDTQRDTRVLGAPPYQVHVMLCPECGKGETPTNRGPIPLGLAELAAVACDAHVETGGKNRAVIPPKLRRQVLARDRYACRGAGCRRTRFLNVHHVVQREDGGKNVLENLITLCSGCHRTLHGLADRVGWDASGRPAMQ